MISRRRFLFASAVLATALSSLASAAEAGTALHTLYLVRHGMYDSEKGADEKTGNPLNALGREQTGFVAARLAALPVKFDAVISSEFTRARETGDMIAAKLGTKCARDALLNESVPRGDGLVGLPISGAEAQFDAAWAHYSKPTPYAPRQDVLACHGDVIRWFVCRALGVDTFQWTRMRIANASLTVITIRPDGTALLMMFNDTSHVPLEKQTWSATNAPFWPSAPATAAQKK